LGCHTFAHCNSWETSPSVFEREIHNNEQALKQILAGGSFSTLSYPISCPRPENKRRAAKHFTCCRGGGQNINIGTIDLNYVSAYFLEQSRRGAQPVKDLIEQNTRENGWLIFATHDVCETPTHLGCTDALFEEIVNFAVNSGAQILTVAEACKVAGITASALNEPRAKISCSVPES